MGYTYRNQGHITDYWPDDEDNCFYIANSCGLAEIIEQAERRWGRSIDLARIQITSEYIHTNCLTYDLYDSGDYTEFLKIELIED